MFGLSTDQEGVDNYPIKRFGADALSISTRAKG